LGPRYVIGIGKFAHDRAQEALRETGLVLGRITHPSPASPKANRGWADLVHQELSALGIQTGPDTAPAQ